MAPARIILAMAILVSVASWQSPVSARAQTWSCDSPEPATAAASPTTAATPQPVSFPDEGGTLTVFAAASLTDAFTKMADDLKTINPNLDVTFNFAGSQAGAACAAEASQAALRKNDATSVTRDITITFSVTPRDFWARDTIRVTGTSVTLQSLAKLSFRLLS